MAKFPKPYYRSQRKTWCVQIGKRQITLGPDRKEAFAEYHRLMASEGRPPEDAQPTAHELCDLFLDHVQRHKAKATYEWYRDYLQSFSDRHGAIVAAKVLPLHVSTWLDSKAGWGASTRRGAITAVKRCWAWAKEEGRLAHNGLAGIKRPKQTRRQVMTEDGLRAILSLTKPGPHRDFFEGLIETGCRPGELCAAEASGVDLARGTMEVVGKAGRRTVVLSARAAEIVRRLAAENPTGPMFRNTRGRPWTYKSLGHALRRRRQKAGVEGAVPYAFRHLFGSLAIERGVDSLLVAELMGHKDVSMLQKHYAHHKDETLKQAVERATGGGGGEKPS